MSDAKPYERQDTSGPDNRRHSASTPGRARGNSADGRLFLHPAIESESHEQYGPSDIWMHKLVIVLVGLPARGKSYISHKLRRYLQWMGYKVEIFNVGNYRRKYGDSHHIKQDSSFFDPANKTAVKEREDIAEAVLVDMLNWLCDDHGHVAMYDATNSTPSRRRKVAAMCAERGVDTLFLESLCDDPAVLEPNIEMKLKSPDYFDKDPAWARADFLARLAAYEKAYVTISDDEDLVFIKLINCGKRIVTEKIRGYLLSTIALYLLNFHVQPRTVYLAKNGKTGWSDEGRLGGNDEPLNVEGKAFGEKLCNYIMAERTANNLLSEDRLWVWTAGSVASEQTVKTLPPDVLVSHLRILNNPRYGKWEGLKPEEIQASWPENYFAWCQNPLRVRIPGGGDSFMDVMERLRPLIIELERQQASLVIVASETVLQALYGYFRDVPKAKCPMVEFRDGEVVKLKPLAYTCDEERIVL